MNTETTNAPAWTPLNHLNSLTQNGVLQGRPSLLIRLYGNLYGTSSTSAAGIEYRIYSDLGRKATEQAHEFTLINNYTGEELQVRYEGLDKPFTYPGGVAAANAFGARWCAIRRQIPALSFHTPDSRWLELIAEALKKVEDFSVSV